MDPEKVSVQHMCMQWHMTTTNLSALYSTHIRISFGFIGFVWLVLCFERDSKIPHGLKVAGPKKKIWGIIWSDGNEGLNSPDNIIYMPDTPEFWTNQSLTVNAHTDKKNGLFERTAAACSRWWRQNANRRGHTATRFSGISSTDWWNLDAGRTNGHLSESHLVTASVCLKARCCQHEPMWTCCLFRCFGWLPMQFLQIPMSV